MSERSHNKGNRNSLDTLGTQPMVIDDTSRTPRRNRLIITDARQSHLPHQIRTLHEDSAPASASETSAPEESLPDAPSDATPPAKPKRAMSKPVLFYGKPGQLDDVLTHVSLQFALDQVTEDRMKVAHLAATFRGLPLTWLTNTRAFESDDFEEFVASVQKEFGLSDEAENGKLQRQLATLTQNGSVQSFALRFKQLSTKAGIPDTIAKAQFISKLKPHIQRALIVNNDDDTSFQAAIDEAIRLDSEFYNIRRSQPRRGKDTSNTPKRDFKGKFVKHE
jgi:hypothetical protein